MAVEKKAVPMREQPAEERRHNFNEVPYGYSPEEAAKEADRCLQCKNRPCVQGCPVNIAIPEFILAIREKDYQKAIDIIHRTDALPAVTGRVCPQEDQCQLHCVVGKIGEPVSIGRLERFVADWELNKRKKITVKHTEKIRECTHRVAVVGSGPAGVSCAADLAEMNYEVTVYEGFHKLGGVLVYGIPEFRLPKEIVRTEIEFLKNIGVKFHTNVLIGRALTIQDLFDEGYAAVFIGTGAGLPNFMKIPGENLNGVYSANEYLTRVNLMKAYEYPLKSETPILKGNKVAVIGGGNVAMDAARTALRLGANHVYLIYRRTEEEMPARSEEVHHAHEEGVEFQYLTAPVRYSGNERGFVNTMECIRMELGDPDSSGRRSPVELKGSEFTMEIDQVIVAIGTTPNPLISMTTKGLKIKRRGEIETDENGLSSIPGVYAGGDIVTGAATVVTAMGAGKKAALAIDAYLKGKQ